MKRRVQKAGGPLPTTDDNPRGWELGPFLLLLILVATFAAYWPTLKNGFVQWDEQLWVMENPLVKDPQGLWRIWTTVKAEWQYYPLLLTSYWLQYQVWGENPVGYHAVGLLFHVLNSFLVLYLLKALGASRWATTVGALLFALHPIQVESVAWMAELKNVQSVFFYLISFLFYLHHRRVRLSSGPAHSPRLSAGGRAAYGACLFFFACALLSKTATVTLPLSLILADRLLDGRWSRQSLARVAPMLFMGIVMGPLTASLEKGPAPEVIPPVFLRPLTASAAIWFYLGKLLVPMHLVPIYPRWDLSTDLPWMWAATMGMAGLLGLVWHYRHRLNELALWGMGHFAVSLLPALGFVPFGWLDNSFVADHFLYLPSIGFFLGVAIYAERWKDLSSTPLQRWISIGVIGVVLVGLVGLTRKQILVWHDPMTFWSYLASENPRSALVHNNLGNAYLRTNDLEEAALHYQDALRLKPNYSLAQMNLGLVFYRQDRLEEAMQQYQKAIASQPRHWRNHYNLAIVYARLGRTNEAVRSAEKAIELATVYGRTDVAAELRAWIQRYQSGSLDLPVTPRK